MEMISLFSNWKIEGYKMCGKALHGAWLVYLYKYFIQLEFDYIMARGGETYMTRLLHAMQVN